MVKWQRRSPRSIGPGQAPTPAARCEIRVLASARELIDSYRLRYEVYGALGYTRGTTRAGLEIDEYDVRAIPFGAFDAASGAMVGTLRLVGSEPRPEYAAVIENILVASGDEALWQQAIAAPRHRLPSIVSDVIERQIAAFNRDRLEVAELSRTIVRPGHRGHGVSRGLMELGLAFAGRLAPVVLIGGCLPEHVPMYARYGYERLPHTTVDHFDSVGQMAHAVVCRTDRLPEPTRTHVAALAEALATGASELTLDIGADSHARYRFAPPKRVRRQTTEW